MLVLTLLISRGAAVTDLRPTDTLIRLNTALPRKKKVDFDWSYFRGEVCRIRAEKKI